MEETKKEKHQFELRELNGGRRAGIVMRSIASHQCSPGLIPMLGVKCVLSFLVVRFVLREITMAHKGQIKKVQQITKLLQIKKNVAANKIKLLQIK